jgi:uncharacterized protein YdeI (YjbR/CyaY-like superfamily)
VAVWLPCRNSWRAGERGDRARGPQRGDLADDIVAAFDASPDAAAFFDSLAQFYRRAYLR